MVNYNPQSSQLTQLSHNSHTLSHNSHNSLTNSNMSTTLDRVVAAGGADRYIVSLEKKLREKDADIAKMTKMLKDMERDMSWQIYFLP